MICISLFTVTTTLFLLLIPKFFAPQAKDDTHSKARMNRLLLRIHTIDQLGLKSGYQKLQKQILIWSLRFLKLPQDQPSVWYITFFYVLALLTLPWFRADFIPSGETHGERYGTFYVWGMVFGQEWVPIADTWLFATDHIVLDVFVFFFLVVWRGTDAMELTCRGLTMPERKLRRQLNELAWFKGVEIVYWLWRSSELVALASFYGGLWPTLGQNILVYWLLFVGYVLGWGKNGIFRKRKHPRFLFLVEGCISCEQQKEKRRNLTLVLSDEEEEDEKKALQYNSSHSIAGATLTQEEEQQKVGFSGNSSCSSSTPFDGNPYVKTRKRKN